MLPRLDEVRQRLRGRRLQTAHARRLQRLRDSLHDMRDVEIGPLAQRIAPTSNDLGDLRIRHGLSLAHVSKYHDRLKHTFTHPTRLPTQHTLATRPRLLRLP